MTNAVLTGLAPVSCADARVLILGSMPGDRSLQQQQYYAHPRNAFWPIMANLCAFAEDLPYLQRLQAVKQAGIAIWDVIDRCQRQGSLDSAIKDEQVNDFSTFFRQHPQIRAIAFNGGKAAQSFRRHVLPDIAINNTVMLLNLPSTSPAFATKTLSDKLHSWQQLLPYLSLHEI